MVSSAACQGKDCSQVHSGCRQDSVLCSCRTEASVSSWPLAGDCFQLLQLPTVPGHMGLTNMVDFKAQSSHEIAAPARCVLQSCKYVVMYT